MKFYWSKSRRTTRAAVRLLPQYRKQGHIWLSIRRLQRLSVTMANLVEEKYAIDVLGKKYLTVSGYPALLKKKAIDQAIEILEQDERRNGKL